MYFQMSAIFPLGLVIFGLVVLVLGFFYNISRIWLGRYHHHYCVFCLEIFTFSRFYDSLLNDCLGLTDKENNNKDAMKVLMKENGFRVDMSKKQVDKRKNSENFKIV